MYYPLGTFKTVAAKALLDNIDFAQKPSWASQDQSSFFYPVFDDYNYSDQPDNVTVGSEITVTIFFCPQVRIENVYLVTFRKSGTTVLRHENGNNSLVEFEDYWTKIAESKLINQIGQVAVSIKYKLVSNTGTGWIAMPIPEPEFTFIPQKLV